MASFINKVKGKLHEHNNKAPSTDADTTSQPADPTHQDTEPSRQDAESSPQESNNDTSSADTKGLEAHNNARSQKGLSPLEWDASLASDAASYAQTLADKNTMEHSGVQGQGENLYMSTGDASFVEATQAWLGEEKDYHGEKIGEGDFAKWGHFSQCLWHSTTHVGLGKAKSSQGATYVVGRYTPQGNMSGEKPY